MSSPNGRARERHYDAIVIGSGHNGSVIAAAFDGPEDRADWHTLIERSVGDRYTADVILSNADPQRT